MSVFIIGVNCETKIRMSLHIYNFKLDSYKKIIFKALELYLLTVMILKVNWNVQVYLVTVS